MRTATLLVALLFVCSGCSTILPAESYVKADRSTYELVAPIVLAATDPNPDNAPHFKGAQASALRLKMKSWLLRIEEAEKAVADAK